MSLYASRLPVAYRIENRTRMVSDPPPQSIRVHKVGKFEESVSRT